MNQDRLYELISLKLSGEATSSEITELETYLLGNPAESHQVEMLIAMWEAKRSASTNKQELFNRHMQRLSNHLSEPVLQYELPEAEIIEMNEQPVRRSAFKKIIWSVSIAASLFLGYLLYSNFISGNEGPKNAARNTVSTKRGSKSKVVLPDGTQVWLNADSRITYNEQFQGQIREVELTGEAFLMWYVMRTGLLSSILQQ